MQELYRIVLKIFISFFLPGYILKSLNTINEIQIFRGDIKDFISSLQIENLFDFFLGLYSVIEPDSKIFRSEYFYYILFFKQVFYIFLSCPPMEYFNFKSIFLFINLVLFFCCLITLFRFQSLIPEVSPIVFINILIKIKKILSNSISMILLFYIIFLFFHFFINSCILKLKVFHSNIKVSKNSYDIYIPSFTSIESMINMISMLWFENKKLDTFISIVIMCICYKLKLEIFGLEKNLQEIIDRNHLYMKGPKPGNYIKVYILDKLRECFKLECFIILICSLVSFVFQDKPMSEYITTIFYFSGFSYRFFKNLNEHFQNINYGIKRGKNR